MNDSDSASGTGEVPKDVPTILSNTSLVVVFKDGTRYRYSNAVKVEGHLAGIVEVFNDDGHVIALIAGETIKTFYWEKQEK